MEKVIFVGNKEVKFKATAGTLTRYRMYFNGDFIKDLMKLNEKLSKVADKNSIEQFNAIDLDMFEKIAWTMAKTADNNIPNREVWLDDFETFSIIQILPEIMQLMIDNMNQQTESKKKLVEVANH